MGAQAGSKAAAWRSQPLPVLHSTPAVMMESFPPWLDDSVSVRPPALSCVCHSLLTCTDQHLADSLTTPAGKTYWIASSRTLHPAPCAFVVLATTGERRGQVGGRPAHQLPPAARRDGPAAKPSEVPGEQRGHDAGGVLAHHGRAARRRGPLPEEHEHGEAPQRHQQPRGGGAGDGAGLLGRPDGAAAAEAEPGRRGAQAAAVRQGGQPQRVPSYGEGVPAELQGADRKGLGRALHPSAPASIPTRTRPDYALLSYHTLQTDASVITPLSLLFCSRRRRRR